ncbi:DUF488 family protein [Luteococcus sanguinis]|uniref:DUF488 family protein n=1 Tax=Luteococcus sanguinis TaxID=174038 RepID=A0ABW1WZK4_9ACTN
MMRLFTIGFTKKKAREFFGLLSDSGATALVDIRLRNRSQLAGFAKRNDLEFFLSPRTPGWRCWRLPCGSV